MKGKQLGTLVVAAAVLGGLGWYVRNSGEQVSERSRIGMGQKLLGEFDVNTVSGIRIVAGTNAVNVALTGDAWTVKERGGYPANYANVAEMVRKLADLKVTKPLNVGPSRLAALELVAPDKGPGVLVELRGAGDKVLKSVLLGKKVMREGQDASPFGGGGGMPVGRYVMVGGDVKTAALVNDALGGSEARSEDWLSKDFFKVEPPVLDVQVMHAEATNSFHLTRTNEFAAWDLADPKPGEKLDAGKAAAYGTLLGSPTFNDIVLAPDLATLGLDKPTLATVRTTAGFTYELKLGKEQGANGDIPMQVTVKADLAKERVAGKDEKPEDKAKLDKEFQEKRAKLEEKLKAEQGYAKWTYLVSKWSIDPVLKKRGDLFADKKSETPAAPGGGFPGLPDGLQGLVPDGK